MITDGLRWYIGHGGFTAEQRSHLLEVADVIDRAHAKARGGGSTRSGTAASRGISNPPCRSSRNGGADMTATERLRALLDERGVEYSREGCETFFKNIHIWAINDKRLCVSISNLTPEQAVEATLERGECRMAHRVFDGDVDVWKCCECGMSCSVTQDAEGGQHAPRYCPNCGRKVVDA